MIIDISGGINIDISGGMSIDNSGGMSTGDGDGLASSDSATAASREWLKNKILESYPSFRIGRTTFKFSACIISGWSLSITQESR